MQRLQVEIWEVPTPLPRPFGTAGGIFDTYHHLVVIARDDDGVTGWGFSGVPLASQLRNAAGHARRLLGDGPIDASALLTVEHRDAAGESDTETKAAASAIALAGWDYVGRRAGMPVADLWGRRPGTQALPAYFSAFWLDSSVDELVDEARRCREQGYRFVKMRVGKSVAEDIERYGAISSIYSEPRSVAVDAFHSWQPSDVRTFLDTVVTPPLWVEDATPYAVMAELRGVSAPVAAGESLETTADLDALREHGGMQYALLDVQRLGGPMRYLEAARVLSVHGARIGSHIYTYQSTHLLACVDQPLLVEVFDWSDALVAHLPALDGEGRMPIVGPGFGVDVQQATLDTYGTCTKVA